MDDEVRLILIRYRVVLFSGVRHDDHHTKTRSASTFHVPGKIVANIDAFFRCNSGSIRAASMYKEG